MYGRTTLFKTYLIRLCLPSDSMKNCGMAHWLRRVKEQKAGSITNTHHKDHYQSKWIFLHYFDIVFLLSSNEISTQLCDATMKQFLLNIAYLLYAITNHWWRLITVDCSNFNAARLHSRQKLKCLAENRLLPAPQWIWYTYRGPLYSAQTHLRRTQVGPGRTV